MSDLRKIIVTATSEMLDNPNKSGIYPTTKFYDRLEAEITEYMELHPTPTNLYDLMLETVKNSQSVSIPLQNTITKYLDYQSMPRVKLNSQAIAESLFNQND